MEKVKNKTQNETINDLGRADLLVMPPPNTFLNIDCMEMMKKCPDKYFDLAIVDPPYGLGSKITNGGTWASKYTDKDSEWDVKPAANYFNELFRVSKNQIIFGGNYFELPTNRHFIAWHKPQMDGMHTMSNVEYAWSSLDRNAQIITANNTGYKRIHPTQKPVELYRKILKMYAKAGDKILDTHVGSASSLIACIEGGFNYWGTEIDKDYYKAAQKRIARAFRQYDLPFNDEAAV